MHVEALIGRFAARLGAADVAYGHGTDNARDEAYRLVTGGLRGRALTPASRAELEALLERRIRARVPVPYLTGEAWLGGVRFDVPPGVMIPRSPIAAVLAVGVAPWLADEPARVLDLCCGTGALGILAARAFPGAHVDLADDDAQAISAAEINIERARIGDRAEILKSSLFDGLAGRRYDLIVCNPPYVPTGELEAARSELEAGFHGMEPPPQVLFRPEGLPFYYASEGIHLEGFSAPMKGQGYPPAVRMAINLVAPGLPLYVKPVTMESADNLAGGDTSNPTPVYGHIKW